MSDERTSHGGYERSDLNVHIIFLSAMALAALMLVSIVGLWWVFVNFRGGTGMTLGAPPPPPGSAAIPPEPRLEVDPVEEWRRLRDTQNDILNSYGWSDESHRTLHIPIEKAMELLVQRAAPGAEGGKAAPQ